ncbi:MAG: cytochrome b N-terminal domain-containing protein [Candidatus Melainabacteria bacterium]|nr:cytochrome b N-terminal domain-containing protein [Candidatus Melainabacteria bacterium]
MANVLTQMKQFPLDAWKFVKDRIDKIDLFDETKADLQKDSPWYQLGALYYLAWIMVVASGLILIAFYIPTTSQAFDSIINIRQNIPFGDIIRGFHKYGADAMIIAATLRIYRMWFCAEYKNKGELTFILAIVLLLIAMYSGLTGYLLIWNQRAFWATKVFATFPTYLDITPANWHWPWESVAGPDKTWLIPNAIGAVTKVIGNLTHQGMTTSQILMGGSSIGQATMTRFFSLHFALSLILLTVTELYFYQNRLKRINLRWPAVVTVVAMLLVTSIIFPAEMGSRANPEVTPLPILSDWYFLALYQMLKYMDPYWATVWTVGIPVITIALVFLDFGKETNPWRRPIFTTIAIMAFIQFIVFSLLIIANQANIDRDPPYWYAHIILMITIGQFWHWALYRQFLPMAIWVAFNIVSSAFYLYHWHVASADWFAQWLQLQGQVEWNPTNLYWNFLWFAYALLQALIFAALWFAHAYSEQKRRAQEESLALQRLATEGAH